MDLFWYNVQYYIHSLDITPLYGFVVVLILWGVGMAYISHKNR